jgi:hypothetical protein
MEEGEYLMIRACFAGLLVVISVLLFPHSTLNAAEKHPTRQIELFF